VEAVLGSCKGVERAVAVLRDSGNRTSRLIAFWFPSSGDNPSEEFLLQELRLKLPAAMVPSALIRVSEFPLTSSGKIDRMALPFSLAPETGNQQNYQPPTTLLEARLSSIWSEILETGPVGINDHFFNLGGDSLQALRMMAEAEKLAGHALHVNWLYQAPTIAQFARNLEEKRYAPLWGSLIILREGGSKPPLFCIHGYGGNVPAYTRLMSVLPADQPVYALQAPGRNDRTRNYTTLREMVREDVKVICAAQPQGPYFLLGYSLGGMVAYELGCQLRALGHQVAMLAILDTLPSKMNLPPSVRITTTPYRLLYLVLKHLRLMDNMTPGKKIIHLGRCMAGFWFRIAGKKKNETFIPKADQALHIPHYEDPDQYYVSLAANCEFTRYPGKIHLFEAGTVPLYLMKTWRHLASQGVVLQHISEMDHMGATESPDFAKKLHELLEDISQEKKNRPWN
jgi:thioesterase domain-containing protein/acyl carrier protein